MEVNQAQRHGQNLDFCSKADPTLVSEEVPKGQCRNHVPGSKLALKIHWYARCPCLTLELFAYVVVQTAIFKNTSILLWFEQLTSLPRQDPQSEAKLKWPESTFSEQCVGNTRVTVEGQLQDLQYTESCALPPLARALLPSGRRAFEPLLGLKK